GRALQEHRRRFKPPSRECLAVRWGAQQSAWRICVMSKRRSVDDRRSAVIERMLVSARLRAPRAAMAGVISIALLAVTASASQASSASFCSSGGQSSTITSNFNGTEIPSGSFIWFSAVLKVSGVPSTGATIHFTNQNISFHANGFTYNTDEAFMPAAEVRIV